VILDADPAAFAFNTHHDSSQCRSAVKPFAAAIAVARIEITDPDTDFISELLGVTVEDDLITLDTSYCPVRADIFAFILIGDPVKLLL
jgi:hypothetical protein